MTPLKDFYKDASHWCKNWFAKKPGVGDDPFMIPCEAINPAATQWCLLGALQARGNVPGELAAVESAIREIFPSFAMDTVGGTIPYDASEHIAQFNNEELTNFADIQKVLTRADELLQS